MKEDDLPPRKPMKRAKGSKKPPQPTIYDYSDVSGKVLTKGNSVVVALQLRAVGFRPPTLHRAPSTKNARLMAQFYANITGQEVRATFPDDSTITEWKLEEGNGNWTEYVDRLNGEYFRPK
jgi:hypothetical protein